MSQRDDNGNNAPDGLDGDVNNVPWIEIYNQFMEACQYVDGLLVSIKEQKNQDDRADMMKRAITTGLFWVNRFDKKLRTMTPEECAENDLVHEMTHRVGELSENMLKYISALEVIQDAMDKQSDDDSEKWQDG